MLFDDLSPKKSYRSILFSVKFRVRVYEVLALLVGRVMPCSALHVWLEAKVDGLRRELFDNQARTPFLRQMAEFIETRKIKVSQRFAIIKADLGAKYKTLTGALVRRNDTLTSDVKPAYQEAKEYFDQAIKNCRGHYHSNRVAYWALLGVLSLVDFPTQVAAFNADGSAGWMVWTICAGVAVVTAAAAHFNGSVLRQKGVGGKTFAVLLSLIITACFAGIALYRMAKFQQLSLLEEMAVKFPPELAAAVYFAINLLIYFTAMAYSYESHEPVSEACRREKKGAAKRYNGAKKHYQMLMQQIEEMEKFWNELEARLNVLPEDEKLEKEQLDGVFRTKREAYTMTYKRADDEYGIRQLSFSVNGAKAHTETTNKTGIPVNAAAHTQTANGEATERS
jgi:hypothetical protein